MRILYPGPINPPGCKTPPTLRLDQVEAIYRTYNEITEPGRSKAVLIGAGMGSGKTVVSVEVMLRSDPKRCLVVGVRDSYNQWRDCVRDQSMGSRRIMRIDKSTPGAANLEHLLNGDDGWYFIGLEMLRAQDWEKVSETITIPADIRAMFGYTEAEAEKQQTSIKQKHTYKNMKPVDLLISDEAHKHANQKSKSLETLEEIRATAKIALSGTFYGNKFINAWSLTTWLWGKNIIGTKGSFEKNYCVVEPIMSKPDPKTGEQIQLTTPGGWPLTKIVGEQEPGEFVETLPCYVFIATPIGPVPKPEVVKFPLAREQQRQYDEMLEQSLTWIPTEISSVREPLVADLDLTQRNRLRTAGLGAMTLVPSGDPDKSDTITFSKNCESSVLTEAYNVLHRPTWVGKKVLILTHSRPFADEVARRIAQKYTVALKTGKVKSKQWESDKARFMLPPSDPMSIQYLVAVISAVGTATDGLQANCAKVLWLSEDDNNTNNMQGANRVWRDGVDLDEYEAVKLVPRNTIAEGVLKKNDTHRKGVLLSVKGDN